MAILAPWYLDETDFKRIVQVLHFKPNESPVNFINRITPLIKALPSHLKADRLLDPLRRFVTNAKKSRGQFCTTHKALSIELIEGLFTLVAQAAGVRLNHLVQYEDDLTAEQRQLVSRARRLHALWQEPKDYEDLFMESPDLAKFGYVSSCSACVLTVIGSHLPTITDLLTLAISSRRKNENTTAKFFRSYLDNTRTSAEAASAHMIADTAGAKLRIVRKQIRKVRKPEYDIDGLSSVHSSEVASQRTRSNSVSSRDSRLAFVDNDAAILSSSHLPPAKQKRFDASRLSLSTVAADMSSKGAHPYRRQVPSTSSVYTAHTVANNARVMDSNLKIPSAVFEEPITTEKRPASPEQEFAEYIPPRADWAKRMTADSQTLPLDRISQDRRKAYKALAGSSTSVFDRFNRQQPPPQRSRFSLAESAIWDDASVMPDSPTETDIPEVPRIPSKYFQGQDWMGATPKPIPKPSDTWGNLSHSSSRRYSHSSAHKASRSRIHHRRPSTVTEEPRDSIHSSRQPDYQLHPRTYHPPSPAASTCSIGTMPSLSRASSSVHSHGLRTPPSPISPISTVHPSRTMLPPSPTATAIDDMYAQCHTNISGPCLADIIARDRALDASQSRMSLGAASNVTSWSHMVRHASQKGKEREPDWYADKKGKGKAREKR